MSVKFEDKSGCSLENRKQFVWCQIFGFCGCYSHSLYDLAFSILEKLYIAKRDDGSYYYDYVGKTETETDLQELILHVFDEKKLTEHGTAVRGCWLTDYGLKMCEFVFNNGEEPDSKGESK